METPLKKKAREFAKAMAELHPNYDKVYGIALDAYLSGCDSITTTTLAIEDEDKHMIEDMLHKGFKISTVAQALGITPSVVRQIGSKFLNKRASGLKQKMN